MQRIVAVRTDPRTRTAKFGTIDYDPSMFGEPGAETEKPAGAASDPHHPGEPILVLVKKGQHQIFVPSEDGRSEVICTLKEGDRILFCDFHPEASPPSNRRFCYSGHWSMPGPAGVVLVQATTLTGRADLNRLHWKDGLPE